MTGMRKMPKVDLRQAHIEREEDDETWCQTCTAPAEEGSRYCLHCGWYWEDVAAGVFDDPEPLFTGQ